MNNIRDKLNTEERYQEIIDKKLQFIQKKKKKIERLIKDDSEGVQRNPKSNKEIIKSTFTTLSGYYFSLLKAEYSIGKDHQTIKNTFINALEAMENAWKGMSLEDFKHGFNEEPYYTSDNYDQLITLLSIGVMLEIEDIVFNRIIDLRNKVKTADKILDFLINRSDTSNPTENIMKFNAHKGVEEIINTKNKDEAIEKIKKYLSKKWLKEVKKMDWETHESKWNIHTGYWCWESGALVKILGLDDSSLKGQQYYPYDMVNFG